VTATRIWQHEVRLAGAGPHDGFFGFSPDGSSLALQGNQDSPSLVSVRTSDFTVQTQTIDYHSLGRDDAWHTELRARVESYYFWLFHVFAVDLGTGESSTELANGAKPSLLAGNGEHVVTLDEDGTKLLTSVALGTGASKAVAVDVPLASYVWLDPGPGGTPRILTRSGDAMLIADHLTGDFFRVDTATGRSLRVAAHAAYPTSTSGRASGAIVSLTLSPSERQLASIGADRRLRFWTYPGLEPLPLELPTTWMYAYVHCELAPVSYAPVAWSPDETLIAAPDSDGNVALRRACDGALLATLPRPDSPDCADYEQRGPSFLAFTRDGSRLGVYFEGSLQIYAVR
jgi:WD40 repeat protein